VKRTTPTNRKLEELHGKNLTRLKGLKTAIDELTERLEAERRIAAHAATTAEAVAVSIERQTQLLIAHSGEMAAITLRLVEVERVAIINNARLDRLLHQPPTGVTAALAQEEENK
jgi:hypothetical protein